jgi:4-amino-4-deoxychorismate lyase
MTHVLVNGAAGTEVPTHDRGLLYGDGVFRTLRVSQGVPIWWADHMAKLAVDCTRIGIECPPDPLLSAEVREVAAGQNACVIRITVTAGIGGRGYRRDPALRPTRIVSRHPLPDGADSWARDGVRVRVCDLRLSDQPRLAGVKNLNRLENVLARAEWDGPEFDEGLMLDVRGHVVEATSANVFMAKSGVLYTPRLNHCGVAGVTRDRVLGACETLEIEVRVEDVALAQLMESDGAFLTNSVTGLVPVNAIGDRALPRCGMIEALTQAVIGN